MNKKEFLQILEVKLAILSDGEKKDIINEYRDTIEEKIKHGKSEEKAIADFGDIDELIKEILSAYNINPNYHDRKKSQEIVDSCESFIKKISRVLSDFTKRLIDDFKHSNHNLSFELVFEILIKVLIFLIISALIRLPFLAVNQLGSSIIAMGFGSLDGIFQFIWGIVVVVVYLICCILIATIMFKKYFNNHLDISDSFKEKKDFKKELKSDKNNIVKNKKKNYLITDSLMIIVKVMVIIFVLIPNWFINICLYSITICVFFYLLQGINLWGLLLLMLGFSVIFTYIALIIHYVTFSFKKIYFYPFIIGVVLLMVGGLLFMLSIFNFSYYDSLDNKNLKMDQVIYEKHLTNVTDIHTYYDEELVIDNNMLDNDVKIVVDYYSGFSLINSSDPTDISISCNKASNNFNKMYKMVINDLKDDKFYDYNNLYKCNTKIYVNENTKKLLSD